MTRKKETGEHNRISIYLLGFKKSDGVGGLLFQMILLVHQGKDK